MDSERSIVFDYLKVCVFFAQASGIWGALSDIGKPCCQAVNISFSRPASGYPQWKGLVFPIQLFNKDILTPFYMPSPRVNSQVSQWLFFHPSGHTSLINSVFTSVLTQLLGELLDDTTTLDFPHLLATSIYIFSSFVPQNQGMRSPYQQSV